MRKLRSLALVCIFGLLFGGCSLFGSVSEADIQLLVQGNLDVIYLNQPSAAYLKLVGSTEDEARQDYEDGVWTEVDSAATFFDVALEYCDESVSQRWFDLLCNIYDSAKYQVAQPVKTDDGYTVEVTVEPIDIFKKVIEEDLADAREERWDNQEFSTQEELEAAWADLILDLLEARLDSIGYLDAETVTVRVEKDEDSYYTMNSDDFYKVDWYIIYYTEFPEGVTIGSEETDSQQV